MVGDTPLVMIGSELGYNAGQLGNDWENNTSIFYHSPVPLKIKDFGHIAIEVDGTVYSYGRYDRVYAGGTKGVGVLIILNKKDYLKYYGRKTDTKEFKLNLSEATEEKIKNYFSEIQKNNNGTSLNEILGQKGIKLNSKYDYDLFKRNCTTITIAALNSAMNEKLPNYVKPNDFFRYLIGRKFSESINLKNKMIQGVEDHPKNKK